MYFPKKFLVNKSGLESCKKCFYYIKNDIAENESKCSKFSFLNRFNLEREYILTIDARKYNEFCGNPGRYFTKKIN
jgi:hypothetical protein